MQIQGGTAVKCWEEVMNLAKELAVDAKAFSAKGTRKAER